PVGVWRLFRGRPDPGDREDRRPGRSAPLVYRDRFLEARHAHHAAVAARPVSGPIVGLVTIGQSPRVDVVPAMAPILGPAVTVRERGALDGLGRTEIAALAPRPGDDILVTRLADGTPVFVAKRHVVARVQAAIGDLERSGVTMTALLCTGAFPALAASRLLVLPHQVLLGVLRALRWPGRLRIVTPSVPHVPQTEARWRADGFDPVVVPLSPYEEESPSELERTGKALRPPNAR